MLAEFFVYLCEQGQYPGSLFTCLVARRHFYVVKKKNWQHP